MIRVVRQGANLRDSRILFEDCTETDRDLNDYWLEVPEDPKGPVRATVQSHFGLAWFFFAEFDRVDGKLRIVEGVGTGRQILAVRPKFEEALRRVGVL